MRKIYKIAIISLFAMNTTVMAQELIFEKELSPHSENVAKLLKDRPLIAKKDQSIKTDLVYNKNNAQFSNFQFFKNNPPQLPNLEKKSNYNLVFNFK